MCDPVSIAIGTTVAGGVMSAYGQYQQGKAAQAVGAQNQAMAEWAARDAQLRGEKEAINVRRQAEQVEGAQRARLAANGVDLGFGTAGALVAQTSFFGEQDVATARNNARKEAWSLRERGRLARFEGDNAARQGKIQAFGTLLGTGGQVASKWKF